MHARQAGLQNPHPRLKYSRRKNRGSMSSQPIEEFSGRFRQAMAAGARMVLIAMAVVHVLPSRGILTHAAASGHGLDWEQAQIPKHSPTQLVSATDGCELLRCTQAARAQDLDFISSQRAGDACALQSPSPRNGYGKHFASTQRPCAMCRSLSPPPPPAPSAGKLSCTSQYMLVGLRWVKRCAYAGL